MVLASKDGIIIKNNVDIEAIEYADILFAFSLFKNNSFTKKKNMIVVRTNIITGSSMAEYSIG